MKHRILKWLSTILPVKIPAGTSTTTTTVDNEPLPKTTQDQAIPKLVQVFKVNNKPLNGRPLFFKPKEGLGPLEYRGSELDTKMHVLEDVKTGELYRLDQAALLGMFKGIMVNYVPPPPPSKDTAEQ